MRRALETLGMAVRELGPDGAVLRWENGQRTPPVTHHAHEEQWADWVVLPGGFAHGDALRAGALAARAPVMRYLRAHVERGRLALGVCNGFQILTETRLLEGALLPNASGHFEAIDVLVEAAPTAPQAWREALAATLANQAPAAPSSRPALRLPIANAAGRFVRAVPASSTAPLPALVYRRPSALTSSAEGPENGEIAGIWGGPRTNVLGLMPHPERAMEDERGAPADGRLFFEALRRYDRARP
jgi:phosphoribosylformylglycinamidine synthase subunit PurQ / glutaminase